MAELNGPPPDLVTCRCPRQWDRNLYSQCPTCLSDLWKLDSASPAPAVDDAPPAPTTHLESALAGIDILVCGRRLTVAAGQTLRLGRDEEFETAEVFRSAMNVSRRHALLRYDGKALYVTDTASSNHTYVNDQELPPDTEYEIRRGQSLRLASNVPVDIQWEC